MYCRNAMQFLRCKRCAKTIELMRNEPQDLHEYQVKICYFVNINPFSSKKRINETMKHMGMDVFHQLLDMDEEIPPVPKQSNKYKNYKQTYQNLNTGQRIKPHTHKIKNAVFVDTSSTAQGGGGSFKNRKPIGEVGCCESGMAKRIHWWTERCLRFPLCLPLSLTIYLPTSLSSMYLSIYRSIYLSLSLFHLITYLPIYLSIYLSLFHLSICLAVYLSIYLSVYLSICLSVYLSICGAVSFSVL